MKEGDTVYDIEGNECTFLIELPHHGYIVEPIYESEYERWEGNPVFVDRVFAEPPIQRLHAGIAAAEAKLAEVQRQLRDETRQLNELRDGYGKRIKSLDERDRALRRIEDFLDGKITHFVIAQWSEIKIFTLEEIRCECDRHETKLLTLFGKTGSLEWQLNKYSDGSGSNYTCYPCCSRDDAITKVGELISEAVEEWRAMPEPKNTYNIQRAKRAALAYCLEFPSDLMEDLSARAIAAWTNSVAAKQKELDAAQKKLDELKARKE